MQPYVPQVSTPRRSTIAAHAVAHAGSTLAHVGSRCRSRVLGLLGAREKHGCEGCARGETEHDHGAEVGRMIRMGLSAESEPRAAAVRWQLLPGRTVKVEVLVKLLPAEVLVARVAAAEGERIAERARQSSLRGRAYFLHSYLLPPILPPSRRTPSRRRSVAASRQQFRAWHRVCGNGHGKCLVCAGCPDWGSIGSPGSLGQVRVGDAALAVGLVDTLCYDGGGIPQRHDESERDEVRDGNHP